MRYPIWMMDNGARQRCYLEWGYEGGRLSEALHKLQGCVITATFQHSSHVLEHGLADRAIPLQPPEELQHRLCTLALLTLHFKVQ